MRFIRPKAALRNRVVAIALGSHTTKAVALERNGAGYVLSGYAILDTPIKEDKTPEAYAVAQVEFFKKIRASFGEQMNEAVLVLGYGETLLRHVEMPTLPVSDLREMLEIGSKTYLQENLPDHVFDCWIPHAPAETEGRPTGKTKVLVGGVGREQLENIKACARGGGFKVGAVTVSQVGQANAVAALLDSARTEAVATLDVGFRNSSICIISEGEIVQSRVVGLGGDKLTRGLAEAMNVSYAAAEGVKLVLPDKVQATLKELLSSLASELKASIDFFEVECGKKVGCVYVSGGSARSGLIIQTLHESIALPFKQWDPTLSLTLAVPEQQVGDVKREAPQLTVAIGAALGYLDPKLLRINLLAKEQEEEEERRRDPMRPSIRAAVFLLAVMVFWSISLGLDLYHTDADLGGYQTQMSNIQKVVDEVADDAKVTADLEHRRVDLRTQAGKRFLYAQVLDALQQTVVDSIVVTRISVEQGVTYVPPVPAQPGSHRKPNPADRGRSVETITMTILAKDFASPGATEKFIETIAAQPFFKANLRPYAPVSLKNRVARQVDTADPSQSFVQITVECVFRERVLGYEEP